MTAREILPNRRPNRTVDLDFGGRHYAVGIGFFPDGRPGEVFATGVQIGSNMDAILDDACVALSLLLQHGVQPAAISKSMSRVRDGKAASAIGALADLIAAETETG